MLSKKKLLILIGVLVVIVIIGIIIFVLPGLKRSETGTPTGVVVTAEETPTYQVEFMNDAEKTRLALPLDSKVQVLTKNADGETEVYRIIRTDADIILDPSQIGNPDMVQPTNPIK